MSQSGIKKDCTNQTPLSGQITAVVHESGAGMSGVWCLEVLCVCRTKDDDTEWMSAQPSIFSLKGPGDWHQLSPSSPVPPPVSPQAYSQQSCVNMDTCKRRVSRIWALIDTFVEFGHYWMECTLKKKGKNIFVSGWSEGQGCCCQWLWQLLDDFTQLLSGFSPSWLPRTTTTNHSWGVMNSKI